MHNNALKSSNRGIVARGRISKNLELRARMHMLRIGETLVTRDPDAIRLANSLSRATKTTSGTRFATRQLPHGEVEIQLVRHTTKSARAVPIDPKSIKPVHVEVMPPPPSKPVHVEVMPANVKLDDSDMMELNALRDLFNGFMQRLENKRK